MLDATVSRCILAYFLDLVYLKIGSFPVFDVHYGSSARFWEYTSGEKIRRFLISMFWAAGLTPES